MPWKGCRFMMMCCSLFMMLVLVVLAIYRSCSEAFTAQQYATNE